MMPSRPSVVANRRSGIMTSDAEEGGAREPIHVSHDEISRVPGRNLSTSSCKPKVAAVSIRSLNLNVKRLE